MLLYISSPAYPDNFSQEKKNEFFPSGKSAMPAVCRPLDAQAFVQSMGLNQLMLNQKAPASVLVQPVIGPIGG